MDIAFFSAQKYERPFFEQILNDPLENVSNECCDENLNYQLLSNIHL